MRHKIIRIIIGIIWTVAAVIQITKGEKVMGMMFGAATAAFLISAFTLENEDK
ncbi:hypothetical protein [Ruminococcus albus]|uniref:Uncharacterized protein n=1 Tax=Ruminococcus albus (strain ATCC 27210 / DSM 20455 / JCM 14654 / NCDO 2250 / 7) TaxID=697329 RepID=E6UL67_RUMA7|nr:hypothetical protein [Ruminococcus albus]ADU24413.1 hypothetical protein Rumal_3990 [Ruminococcus albus 7 = DSM 20455]